MEGVEGKDVGLEGVLTLSFSLKSRRVGRPGERGREGRERQHPGAGAATRTPFAASPAFEPSLAPPPDAFLAREVAFFLRFLRYLAKCSW